jgi:hypothetical protein
VDDPHLKYTQSPQGSVVVDWTAFRREWMRFPDVNFSGTVEDKRDNRDPEQVWIEELAKRNGETLMLPPDEVGLINSPEDVGGWFVP